MKKNRVLGIASLAAGFFCMAACSAWFLARGALNVSAQNNYSTDAVTNVDKTIHFTGGAAGSSVKSSTYNTSFAFSGDGRYEDTANYISTRTYHDLQTSSSDTNGVFAASDNDYVPLNNGYTVRYENKTAPAGYCYFGYHGSYLVFDSFNSFSVSSLVIESNDPSEILTINLNAPFIHGGKEYTVACSNELYSSLTVVNTRLDVTFIGKFRFILSPIDSSTYPPFIFTPGDLYIDVSGEGSYVYVEAQENTDIANGNMSLITSAAFHLSGEGTFYINNLNPDMDHTIDVWNQPRWSTNSDYLIEIEAPLYLVQSNLADHIFSGFNSGTDYHILRFVLGRSNNSSMIYLAYTETPSTLTPFPIYSDYQFSASGNYQHYGSATSTDVLAKATLGNTGTGGDNIVYLVNSGTVQSRAILITRNSDAVLVSFDKNGCEITGPLPPALKVNNKIGSLRGGYWTTVGGWNNYGWYTANNVRDDAHSVIPGVTNLSGITTIYANGDCDAEFRKEKLKMDSDVQNQCTEAGCMTGILNYLSAHSSASDAPDAGWRTRFLGGADLDLQADPAEFAGYPQQVRRLIWWCRNNGYVVAKDATQGFVINQLNGAPGVVATSSISMRSSSIIAITVASIAATLSFITIVVLSKRKKNSR